MNMKGKKGQVNEANRELRKEGWAAKTTITTANGRLKLTGGEGAGDLFTNLYQR